MVNVMVLQDFSFPVLIHMVPYIISHAMIMRIMLRNAQIGKPDRCYLLNMMDMLEGNQPVVGT